MNLIKDRWISVRRSSGEIEKIAPRGLTDEIDADPIIRLATLVPTSTQRSRSS